MEYVAVLLPSIVVGLLFWFAMKSIFNADKASARLRPRPRQKPKAGLRHPLTALSRNRIDKPPHFSPNIHRNHSVL